MEISQSKKPQISAVIFDLDGTLLNTEQVTKDVLKDFLAKYGRAQDAEKEKRRLGMTFIDSSVTVVNDYDLPLTPEQFREEIVPMYYGRWKLAKPLPGANRLMKHLHNHGVPFALASNALRKNIDGKISHHDGWKERFKVILGSDQVKSGKPSPDIFLEAAERMGVDPLNCLVIEDSIVGVKAGKAAGMKVVAVPSLQTEADSYSIADLILHSLLEFQPEQWGLPQFGDWVNDALPIEPIRLTGFFTNGLLQIYSDDELPDQIWGLFLGFAKFDDSKTSKAVISIGWSLGCDTRRTIKPCMLEETDVEKYDGKMQLLLLGLLRRSCDEGNKLDNIDITDEDRMAADAALDLPEFCNKSFTSDAENGLCID
ncbi:bifunctional riboflavin kinase/FMN phosphatase-like [Andrographis paniculata]|uniref:bifunctional riboflavin kinase/FMN phosphatase-like n=1 Tax=Andrographis paniculata TaxID=175694 RepID=UPI0021E72667|nr:bifunctional riboflavin kinase/FMN phosphatase-like [Andrographis paniculata]